MTRDVAMSGANFDLNTNAVTFRRLTRQKLGT